MQTAAVEPKVAHSPRTARIEVQPGTEVMVYDGGGSGDPGAVREVGDGGCVVKLDHADGEQQVPWKQIHIPADQFVGLLPPRQDTGLVLGKVGQWGVQGRIDAQPGTEVMVYDVDESGKPGVVQQVGEGGCMVKLNDHDVEQQVPWEQLQILGGESVSITIKPGVKVRSWVDGVTEPGTVLAIQPLGCVLSNGDGLVRPTFARWDDMDLDLGQFFGAAGELSSVQQPRPKTEAQTVADAEPEVETESVADPELPPGQLTLPSGIYEHLDDCRRLAIGVVTILDDLVNKGKNPHEIDTHAAPANEIAREVVKRLCTLLSTVEVDYGEPEICDDCLEKAPPTNAELAVIGG